MKKLNSLLIIVFLAIVIGTTANAQKIGHVYL